MVLQTEKFYSVENDKIILKITTGKYDVRYFLCFKSTVFQLFSKGPLSNRYGIIR